VTLVKYFRTNPELKTDIGNFKFEKDIGSGGNASVLEFKRGTLSFAIKFLLANDDSKLRRFQDEFFCAAQIPSNPHIVDVYHFDMIEIDEKKYALIVMKLYHNNLHKLGNAVGKPTTERASTGLRLFENLMAGLRHLHGYGIVHRDIKPQNIFHDATLDKLVIGDLGIAHFKSDKFAKQSKTKSGERLANYLYSAPEQVDSKNEISAAADIYALAQVIQWFLTGSPIRGLGRQRFLTDEPDETLSMLDAFADVALLQNASDRFQSIDEIEQFVGRRKKPDPWKKIRAFDDAIRQSFPRIRTTLATSDHQEITGFLLTFQKICTASDFWYVQADGGDNQLEGIEQLTPTKWLMNDSTELAISTLLIHRDGAYPYKNFFILVLDPEQPFTWTDVGGTPVARTPIGHDECDWAILMDERLYLDPDETRNGYVLTGGRPLQVSSDRFKARCRFVVPYGVMIVPRDTASADMVDREPTSELMRAAIKSKNLQPVDLKNYLNATRRYHSRVLTNFN
jgi:eukaryotic-like serine/threonine-protein kinase